MPAVSITVSFCRKPSQYSLVGSKTLHRSKPRIQRIVLRDGEGPVAAVLLTMICALDSGIATVKPVAESDGRQADRKADQRDKHGWLAQNALQPHATSPSGASTSVLNTCISSAPSAPSMARWSKLPVALITVAMASASSTT